MLRKSKLLIRAQRDHEDQSYIKGILNEMNNAEFVDFILSSGSYENWRGQKINLENMDSDDQILYLRMLSQNSQALKSKVLKGDPASSAISIPFAMCPSEMDSLDFLNAKRFPSNVVMDCWDLHNLLDEYFGACYHHERYNERFEPGFKDLMMKRILSFFNGDIKAMIAGDKFTDWWDDLGMSEIIEMSQIIGDFAPLTNLSEADKARLLAVHTVDRGPMSLED